MSSAREEILARVRRANTGIAASGEIARHYQQVGLRSAEERIELFVDRLLDYGSDVVRCSAREISSSTGEILARRGFKRVLIPPGLASEWLPEAVEFIRDDGSSLADAVIGEAVLTGCALAIAVTGTIVLRHSCEEGRRAITLIPDYHLCVVFESQVVETVPEGIRLMASFGAAPLTTISGSSATADIEMTRVKGVHGPRTLDVILVST